MAGRWRLIPTPEAEEEEEVDLFGHLPDAIIRRIFSFLPFKDLVKTSVLSKQWRFAWTSTPNIDLSVPSEGVVPLISRALRLCTAPKVEKLHLDAATSDLFISAKLDLWFRFAAARKVEDASLGFGLLYHFVPPFLCDCASLVSLQVSKCRFLGDVIINWHSLKKLCLQDVFLDNDRIRKILSGSPVLESLILRETYGMCDLWIDSRSLRELVIEDVYVSSLDISVPSLLSLRLSGRFVLISFRLNGLSSIAEAELNYDKPTACSGYLSDQLKCIFEQLQHLSKITIGSWCLKVLSAVEVKAMPYLSLRWRNIIVYTTVCKRDLVGMAYLLQSSPLLERLVICNPKSNNVKFENKDFPELSDFDEKQFWRSQKELYCVANHLKRVEIVGFEFDNERSKLLLALARFLLEEAVRLEKMIINAELRMLHRGIPIDPHYLWDFHDVIQREEGSRRASQNAEVILNYSFKGLPCVL